MEYLPKNLKLKRCFIRFEPNIDEGTMFIFNKEDGNMLEGDYYSYLVLKAIQDGNDLDLLANEISKINEQPLTEVYFNINNIIDIMVKEGFIINDDRKICKKTGKSIRIAIIDSGVDITHPFLSRASITQLTFVDNTFKEVSPSDPFGHGTACAGLIYKLAKDASIISLQCFNSKGASDGKAILEALRWCIENKIHIVNLSCGSLSDVYEAELIELGNKCIENNILVFASCHDTGYCPSPAKYPQFLAVWGKSVKGRYTYYYSNDRFIAHGGRQTLCWIQPRYIYGDGSSFATARMCGIAAKIYECYPTAKYDELIEMLKQNASTNFSDINPMKRDNIIEQNSRLFKIKRAAIYSFTKEMHPLVSFPDLTGIDVVSVIDPSKKISDDRKESIKNIPFYHIINENSLGNSDTLLVSKTSVYENLAQKDVLYHVLNTALDLGKNIYSLEYIDKNMYPDIYKKANRKGLKIRHPMIGEEDYGNSQFYREMYGHLGADTPIVGVFGTGVSQGKFTLQLMLRRFLKQRGFKVNNFGSETHCELLGFEGFCPLEMNSSIRFPREQIIRYIQGEMRRLEIENNPDIIIVGGQSGVVPYSYFLNDDEYTLPTLSFLMGTVPHAYILCINANDEFDFIQDSINVLESLGKGKVIALVSSKIIKTMEENSRLIHTRTLSSLEYQDLAKRVKSTFSLPLYDIIEQNNVYMLIDTICNYFN
jgi:uncharacterized NAD-dependent epimerase/dehydratase family protein